MTSYAYEVGQAVYIRRDQRVHLALDKITRITRASVITEKNGAFRLTSQEFAGSGKISRHSGAGGWGVTTNLYPDDHPDVVFLMQRAQQEARRDRRRNARADAHDLLSEWAEKGTEEALNVAVARLVRAQSTYGEPA